ncbi:MAG: glycyl-radical enzyme activating protein [Acetivibrio sp.]
MEGILFNIQKFSLHDGPGIRTVVFFKGCPLKCKWCANPESQSSKTQVLWEEEKCRKCRICVQSCNFSALSFKGDSIYIDDSLCSSCRQCISLCPGHALSLEGEYKTVSEVVRVCLQDKDFYEESNGGVTLSGGEALMQPAFAMELLIELKKQHIHTAIETTGFASSSIFDEVTSYADLLLFDVKHWDDLLHREGTGVSNVPILHNLKAALASGKNVLPRIPVIPQFNDSLEDAAAFSDCLLKAGASEVQLLPFHQFGEKKYSMLGKPYPYKDISAFHEEDLMEFQQVFLSHGIHAFF